MKLETRGLLDRPTISVEQAAAIFGIGRNAAYEAVRRGEIPSVRLGGRILVPTAAIRKMLYVDGGQNETSTAAK